MKRKLSDGVEEIFSDETTGIKGYILPDCDCPNPVEDYGAEVDGPEHESWKEGDVWGVVIEDAKGERIDSCFGFFGRDYALDEGRSMFNHAVDAAMDLSEIAVNGAL